MSCANGFSAWIVALVEAGTIGWAGGGGWLWMVLSLFHHVDIDIGKCIMRSRVDLRA